MDAFSQVGFSIICPSCEQHHPLERDYVEPTVVFIVCHWCELPIRRDITAQDIERKERQRWQRTTSVLTRLA